MNSTALTTRPQTHEALQTRFGYDAEQWEIITNDLAPGAKPAELAYFLARAEETQLSPLARQIYFIPRKDRDTTKWTIQVGIDGYRLIAARTGEYVGSDDAIYDSEEAAHPEKATVTVWRLVGGVRCPFTASARWSEYKADGTKGFMWTKMPYLMLAKCAEALALRKAFPQELSGIYTDDEMMQADAPTERVTARIADPRDEVVTPRPAPPAQLPKAQYTQRAAPQPRAAAPPTAPVTATAKFTIPPAAVSAFWAEKATSKEQKRTFLGQLFPGREDGRGEVSLLAVRSQAELDAVLSLSRGEAEVRYDKDGTPFAARLPRPEEGDLTPEEAAAYDAAIAAEQAVQDGGGR